MFYKLFAALLDSLGLAVCLFDGEDRTLLWNPSFLRFFPEHENHVHVGEPYRENLHRFYTVRLSPEEIPHIERYIEDGIKRHRSQTRPFVFMHRERWLKVASLPTPDGNRLRVWMQIPAPGAGGGLGVSGIPEASTAQGRLAVLENVADGVMVLDAGQRITSVNDHFLQIHGLRSKEQAVGRCYHDILQALWDQAACSNTTSGDNPSWELSLRDNARFDGAPFEIPLPGDRWLRVVIHRNPDGLGFGIHADITALKRQQRELQEAEQRARDSEARYRQVAEELQAEKLLLEQSEARFRTVFEYSGVATCVTLPGGEFVEFNDAICRLLGHTREELARLDFARIVDPGDRERLLGSLRENLTCHQSSSLQTEARLIRHDGVRVWGLFSFAPLRDLDTQNDLVISHIQDITARKLAEEERNQLLTQLYHQATHDDLTGLLNRAYFEQLLRTTIREQYRSESSHSLCFLDLDGFKQVNDTAGHAAGDALLRTVAQVFVTSVRPSDTVARLGGDEFGIVLWDCPTEAAEQTCRQLIERLNGLSFAWEEQSFSIGVSIGISAFKPARVSMDQLMKQADLACYAAKRAGRNRVHRHITTLPI